MSDSEADAEILVYPSSKVASITKLKNKITKSIDDECVQDTETLLAWKEKLIEKIKSFEDACSAETAKNATDEEHAYFKKWYKKQKRANDLYVNKLEHFILENGTEKSSSEEEIEIRRKEDEDERAEPRKKKEDDDEDSFEENSEKSLIQCLKTLTTSTHLPQRTPEKFDGSDVTEYLS